MILYHATPRKHLAAIEAEGLDPHEVRRQAQGSLAPYQIQARVGSSAHPATAHKTQEVVRDQAVDSFAQAKLTRRWRGLWSCPVLLSLEFEDVIDADLTRAITHQGRIAPNVLVYRHQIAEMSPNV